MELGSLTEVLDVDDVVGEVDHSNEEAEALVDAYMIDLGPWHVALKDINCAQSFVYEMRCMNAVKRDDVDCSLRLEVWRNYLIKKA